MADQGSPVVGDQVLVHARLVAAGVLAKDQVPGDYFGAVFHVNRGDDFIALDFQFNAVALQRADHCFRPGFPAGNQRHERKQIKNSA